MSKNIRNIVETLRIFYETDDHFFRSFAPKQQYVLMNGVVKQIGTSSELPFQRRLHRGKGEMKKVK